MTSGEVVRAVQEQNVQVSGGALGAEPAPTRQRFQLMVKTQGRFDDPRQFRQIIVRATPKADWCGCRTWRASSSARRTTSRIPISTASRPWRSAIFQRPGTNALAIGGRDHRDDGAN